MKIELFDYLKKYIQGRFPMYYKESEQTDFMSFINMIASDPIFKKMIEEHTKDGDFEESLHSGRFNHTIDELVNMYAQRRYTDIWAKLENLYHYIKTQITEKAEGIDKISDITVDDISREIALQLFQNNNFEASYYMNGSYNDIFLSHFDTYCEKIVANCYSYVEKVIKNSDIKIDGDAQTFAYLVELTTGSIVHDFSANNILDGMHDENIIKRFRFYLKRLKKDVSDYVLKVVNDMDLLVGIPVALVVEDITNLVMSSSEISVKKLLDGKLDNFIESCALKKRMVFNSNDVVQYIYKFIYRINTAGMSEEELFHTSKSIWSSIYHNNRNCQYGDILSGKYDKVITDIFNRRSSMYLSIKGLDLEDEIEYKPQKRRMSKQQIGLIALVIVVSLVIGSLAHNIGSGIVAREELDKFDNFEYSYMWVTGAPGYKPTAENAMDFYLKAKNGGYDDEYCYIGFYRAYTNVRDNRLQIMDSMLRLIKEKAKENKDIYGDLYDSIQSCDCYLDFIFDRLKEMGCEKILKDKYKEALDAYRIAMSLGGEPFEKLSQKDQKLIEEIVDMYKKYSKRAESAFGEILITDDVSLGDSFEDMGGKHNGRC